MNEYVFGKSLNKIIHGGDYNPEQWLDRPDVLQKDIEYMKEAGINEATLGVFSWAMYEPGEGDFNFDWLVQIMDNLYKNGIHTILATPSGARPVWLDNKYPEVMRVDANGNRNRHGGRHNHCMSSEKYREKVMAKLLCLARFDYTFLVLFRQESCYNISRYYRRILFNFQDNVQTDMKFRLMDITRQYK